MVRWRRFFFRFLDPGGAGGEPAPLDAVAANRDAEGIMEDDEGVPLPPPPPPLPPLPPEPPPAPLLPPPPPPPPEPSDLQSPRLYM